MLNLSIITAALEHIEENLQNTLNADELAAAVFTSPSALSKLFRYALRCPVGNYITKRRLSAAARDLLEGASVTAAALDYGWGSPEAFSRAFKRFWGISPDKFRKTRRFAGLHPKFSIGNEEEEFIMTKRKPIDISELYSYLK